MNGAASGLMEALRSACTLTDDPDDKWGNIPIGATSWFLYGGGGIGGWGTLCGVPNGCCVVLNMIDLHASASNVLGYYSETEFPTSAMCDAYDGRGPVPIPDNEVLAKTVSNSPLCHVSISKWCDAAGVSMAATDEDGRKYKNDRCGKICADMAAMTAGLINDAESYGYDIPNATAACQECHTSGTIENGPVGFGKMDCAGCHTKDAVIISRRHPRR